MRTIFGKREHGIANVFIFLILAMFLVGSTLLVVMGARVYRGTSDRSDAHSQARVLCAYVRSAVRGDDARAVIGKETIDGMDVLTVTNDYGGESYVRRLYCADGYLRESFSSLEEEEEEYDPDFDDIEDTEAEEGDAWGGEPVCAAQSFEFTIDGNLLTAVLQDAAGEVHTLYIALHAAQA